MASNSSEISPFNRLSRSGSSLDEPETNQATWNEFTRFKDYKETVPYHTSLAGIMSAFSEEDVSSYQNGAIPKEGSSGGRSPGNVALGLKGHVHSSSHWPRSTKALRQKYQEYIASRALVLGFGLGASMMMLVISMLVM